MAGDFLKTARVLLATLAGFLLTACAEPPASTNTAAERPAIPAPSAEILTRQALIQVSLARQPADLLIHGATVLNVFTSEWMPDQDIVIKGERIAWVGPADTWPGEATKRFDASGLYAVPGFGDSHKHIESTYLTPEYEAALVVPKGSTWTVEDSHELSNVDGDLNIDFWLEAERQGSPFKIFPTVGSATPPTIYEFGGGHYGYEEMVGFMMQDPRVVGLGEVMDWPAVSHPTPPGLGFPGSARIWGMIQATWEQRGVVEGHASGMRGRDEINAFAAAGLSSDHEVREAEEGLLKLRSGVFIEARVDAVRAMFPLLLKTGITDWSNVSVTTDDRDVHATRELGAMDYNIRTALEAGVPTAIAYQLGSYNTARHFRIDHLVGSIAPGRYADVVLLRDIEKVDIVEVFANGRHAASAGRFLLQTPKIDYPERLNRTVNIGRPLTADDFQIAAPPGRDTVKAAVMEPFNFVDRFATVEMPVTDGLVLPDVSKGISKVAMVDRYHGKTSVSRMFWRKVGPLTPDSALASSQSHDLHNIWAVGNSDAAMAAAVNAIADMQGGWALVREGKVVARVRLEIGGLMSQRPDTEVAAELEALLNAADAMQWIESPGLPERMRFAFLTAVPWRWQLVAPYPGNPDGFVNVATGETHPVIW
ncbi:MAG: adenine deaminase [Pseudomonadales bacterium]|jgi:adenine deaminase